MRRGLIDMVILTCLIAGLTGTAWAKEADQPAVKVLDVTETTPRLEVRHSQIGFRDTLLFYTFSDQNAVLKLRFGNKDKTFPVSATVYFFADDVTDEGIKKWLNNQHSDGLFPDVPEPMSTHTVPGKVCKVTSSKSVGKSAGPRGEHENFEVTFKVESYTDKKTFTLKLFTGKTKVHVKVKP